ncbi:hypothetical protein EZV73_19275 [Acidaminobacter sp. JC074]|uniref:hypothetical protein n=1 Tax=Acidaminobacter sp. JC074 TaxID=2530199 RepID=UPI001F0D0E97|nr:hypothetical protein [Acidaminobacter sp. JC074]MCH4889733.1 hypothetical protein [Acidaminobacter sp. JC074]
MGQWWQLMTQFERFFWIIALPATTFMVLQTVMTFLGLGGDDLDADVDVDTDGDFDLDMESDGDIDTEAESDFSFAWHIFSVRNLIAFLTFFGWTGIVLIPKMDSNVLVITLSVIGGFIAMMVSFGLFYFMQKMTNDGSVKPSHAVGRVGHVYIPIPKDKSGLGKITLIISGASKELDAMTNDPETIKTNTPVKVVGLIEKNILLVKRVDEKE